MSLPISVMATVLNPPSVPAVPAGPLGWVDDELVGMASDEFKLLSTNTPNDVKLARTKANFDYAGTKWADDAAVATAIGSSIEYSFSAVGIDPATGDMVGWFGGHTNGGDSSIFAFNPDTSFAWSLAVKGTRYQTSQYTEVANVTAATNANPCVVTVDDASAFREKDQVAFASVGGMTDLNGNSYHIWSISGNDLTLYNIDGDWDNAATAVDATGFGTYTSGGTATVIPNPHDNGGDNNYARTNADDEVMPSAIHAYHAVKKGADDDWLMGGESVFDTNGSQHMNRLYLYNEGNTPKLRRWYHDSRIFGGTGLDQATRRGGMAAARGPFAFNSNDGKFYVWESTNNLFAWNIYRWNADLTYREWITSSSGEGPGDGFDAVILPQPGDSAKRVLFCHNSDSHASREFAVCTDIQGTPAASMRVYSGAFFNTGIGSGGDARAWFKDDDDNIVYWGGAGVLGKVTVSSNLDAWTTAQQGSGGTGDVPAETAGSFCAGAALPGKDAYLLCCNGKVWLYKV